MTSLWLRLLWGAVAAGLSLAVFLVYGYVQGLRADRDEWAVLARQGQEDLEELGQEVRRLRAEAETLRLDNENLRRQVEEYRRREGSRSKVLFLGGLDSDIGPGATIWGPIAQSLLAAGYTEADLLLFSYRGGVLNGLGEYAPDPYGCQDTRQRLRQSTDRLVRFLAAYHALNPEVELTVVGHSLGGRVALEAVNQTLGDGQRDRGPGRAMNRMPPGYNNWGDTRLRVVTIDAPLQGVRLGKAWAAWLKGCDLTTGVFTELSRDRWWPAQDPTRVLTVGNRWDCLYAPTSCSAAWLGGLGTLLSALGAVGLDGLSDEAETQMAPGAQHYWAPAPALDDFVGSHQVALVWPESVERVVRFIGPPRRPSSAG